jgi:hypothetical protein
VREVGLAGVAALDLELLVLAAEVDEDVRQAAARRHGGLISSIGRVDTMGRKGRTECRGRC